MNLLKQLWNWFTTPNTDDCCDAEVCEQNTPVGKSKHKWI